MDTPNRHDEKANNHYLLQRIAEGDETAFRQLYDRYAATVFSLSLLYLKSHSAAQDMVQEVFLKVWAKRTGLTVIENFEGWLHLVTRNLLIDVIRKKAAQQHFPFKEIEMVTPSADPQQAMEGKEVALVIRQAIDNLSPRQKEIYLLAREQGLKHHEIAERLGLSPATVREHMKQALRNLRERLAAKLGLLLLFIQALK